MILSKQEWEKSYHKRYPNELKDESSAFLLHVHSHLMLLQMDVDPQEKEESREALHEIFIERYKALTLRAAVIGLPPSDWPSIQLDLPLILKVGLETYLKEKVTVL